MLFYSFHQLSFTLSKLDRMKNVLLVLFLNLISLAAITQIYCDGIRYETRLFAEIDSVKNVQFGQNTTQIGFPVTLKMDIYMPANDTLTNRPLVIFAHGGSFVVGNRTEMQPLCLEFASRGFVAATIDYRLFDNFIAQLDSILAFDVVMEAVSDYKAAVRMFRESAKNGNPYGIDSNMIIVSGASAGAITADHLAYLDSTDLIPAVLDSIIQSNGGWEGNSSNNFQFSSKAQMVLNYSGALKSADWISAGEVPLFSVHELNDPTVPYGNAITSSLGTPIMVSGSGAMHPVATEKGIPNRLITIESNGHVKYFLDGPNTEIYAIVIDSTVAFIQRQMCETPEGFDEKLRSKSAKIFPNPSSGNFQISGLNSGVQSIEIINQLGQIIWSGDVENEREISISSIENGLYFVQIKNQTETEIIKWLVKK